MAQRSSCSPPFQVVEFPL